MRAICRRKVVEDRGVEGDDGAWTLTPKWCDATRLVVSLPTFSSSIVRWHGKKLLSLRYIIHMLSHVIRLLIYHVQFI